MATRTTNKPTPIDEAAKQALERRRDRTAQGLAPVEVTVEQRAGARELRERDHVDGCPAVAAPDGPARVEVYAERAAAPGPSLRREGIERGDYVVVVRCQMCGGIRYRSGQQKAADAVAAVDGYIDSQLLAMTGEDAEPATELDEDLD